ncbi:unnamed protein product [Rhodiola kirilowii]
MESEVDHYAVLGLPSGEEGSKLTDKEISKAYKLKALELHPDKRPDDPNAHDNFQKLKSSYEILKDEKARKLFDDLLRVKRERERRQYQSDSKRRRMVSDLEERERSSFVPDPATKARDEEERIARKLKEEIARIRAMHASKGVTASSAQPKKETQGVGKEGGGGLEKEKVLKVSWEKGGLEYTAEMLRAIFSKFGKVEDVVIKGSKKKGSALVVMSSTDAVAAATGSVCGDLSNPLLVLPLQPAAVPFAQDFPSVQKPVESVSISKLVGPGYQAFEDSVLEKLQRVCHLVL